MSEKELDYYRILLKILKEYNCYQKNIVHDEISNNNES